MVKRNSTTKIFHGLRMQNQLPMLLLFTVVFFPSNCANSNLMLVGPKDLLMFRYAGKIMHQICVLPQSAIAGSGTRGRVTRFGMTNVTLETRSKESGRNFEILRSILQQIPLTF